MRSFKKLSPFVTPAGAAIALICFFLPWVEASCGPVTVRANGPRIGGVFWLVLAAAIVILVTFPYFWKRREWFWLKIVTLAASAVGILVILYKFLDTFSSGKIDLKLTDIGSILRIGSFGTIFGFVLAALGAFYFYPNGSPKAARPSVNKKDG
ncbi:MAG: hypothetical protein PHR28_03430 [candidate division Zixibacteria bacterium]|nr:hypothetical protein [candidate division Zixibacteria bacterium]